MPLPDLGLHPREAVRQLTEWLLREGRFLPDNTVLFQRFCDRLPEVGIPLDRATLHLRALHPEYRGVARIWQPGQPLAERLMDHGIEKTATYIELKAMRRFIGHMLTTYIGAEAGRLILEGQVRRGDVRTITAALMLVDMRDFSLLSDRMSPRAVIRMLNEYFDCVIPPVHA